MWIKLSFLMEGCWPTMTLVFTPGPPHGSMDANPESLYPHPWHPMGGAIIPQGGQGPSLVPQNSMWIKLSFLNPKPSLNPKPQTLISQNWGTGSKTFCWVHRQIPTHFQRDSTILWE